MNSEVWREKFWNGPTEEVNWHSESWLLLLWEYNHGFAGKHGVTSFYDLIAALVPYMCNRAWHGHGVIENILFLCLLSCCFPWFCAESLWPSRLSSVLCRLLIVWVILHAHFLLSWVEVSFFPPFPNKPSLRGTESFNVRWGDLELLRVDGFNLCMCWVENHMVTEYLNEGVFICHLAD